MIDEKLFAEHCFDLLGDMPKYLVKAGQEAQCSHCRGTGERLVATDTEGFRRDLLFALMQSAGARTSHVFPGDCCPYCEGKGLDPQRQKELASKAIAADWYATFQELFVPEPSNG